MKTKKVINGIIYMYTGPSGKSYIGQTINEYSRIYAHKLAKYKDSNAFHNAIRKYGFDAFEYKILHSGISDINELNKLEETEILQRDTMSPNGYNLQSGGFSRKMSEETKT